MVDRSNLDAEETALEWEFLESWHFCRRTLGVPVHRTPEERARDEARARELDVIAAEHCRVHGVTRPRTAEEIYGGPLPCLQDALPGYYAHWGHLIHAGEPSGTDPEGNARAAS